MSTGLKANDDGSAAIQVAGSDYLTVTQGGAVTFVTSPTTMPTQTLHPSGSVGTPSISFTGDTNTGIYRPYADAVAITGGGTQQAYFAGGEFGFNSGYGSVAPAYGCRAWVNFNGQTTVNSDINASYSQSGTTVTVNTSPTPHGLQSNQLIFNDITSGTAVDGTYLVTVTDGFSFTYTAGTSLTTSGTCILRQNLIRASANVSSITDIGVGNFSVNFITAMPDANYCIVGSCALSAAGGYSRTFSPIAVAVTSPVTPTIPTTVGFRAATTVTTTAGLEDMLYTHIAVFR